MNGERESFKHQLDEELKEITLSDARRNAITAQIHPKGWLAQMKALWNKELEIPLLPAGAAFVFLLAVVVILKIQNSETDTTSIVELQSKQIIEVDGNSYWKDEFEKAVAMSENQN